MIYPLRKIVTYGYKFLEKGRWGELHPGIDISAGVGDSDIGEPILAPAKGEITHVARNVKNWGNHFHLKCETLLGTRWFHFAHCQEIFHQVGDVVAEGQVIAKVGNTGGDWTAHLHFECKKKPTGVSFYPNKQTTKEFILEHYEDPLVFIDTINKLIKENNEIEGLKELLKTRENQLEEANREIEGLKTQVRENEKRYNDFINALWEKLSPLTVGEKGEPTILGEITRLIEKEDAFVKLESQLKEERERRKEFLEKVGGLVLCPLEDESGVLEALEGLVDREKTDQETIKKLSKEIEELKKKKRIDNYNNLELIKIIIRRILRREI